MEPGKINLTSNLFTPPIQPKLSVPNINLNSSDDSSESNGAFIIILIVTIIFVFFGLIFYSYFVIYSPNEYTFMDMFKPENSYDGKDVNQKDNFDVCNNTLDCHLGFLCINGKCTNMKVYDNCVGDDDCPESFICNKTNGQCIVAPDNTDDVQCKSAVDCKLKGICLNGKCIKRPYMNFKSQDPFHNQDEGVTYLTYSKPLLKKSVFKNLARS